MEAKEIIKKIEELSLLEALFDEDNLSDAELYSDENEEVMVEDNEAYIKELFGEIEWLDGRYDSSEFWQVIHLKDHNVYLKIEGEYDSYGQGEHDYDTVKEVFPKKVTQTIYE